jgi:hypothetical protein
MKKSYITIFIEAIVVGILLILVFSSIKYFLPTQNQTIQLFIAGAMFHLLCELFGINIWYVKNYAQILGLCQ